MENTENLSPKKTSFRKNDRELILNISMFLLGKEELRKQFWNVTSVNYDRSEHKVSIGINTTEGKLGTTLSKLRKVSKDLSNHLHEVGQTFKRAKIVFFVDKEQEEIERIYSLIEKVAG